jgi:hypothetical protein
MTNALRPQPNAIGLFSRRHSRGPRKYKHGRALHAKRAIFAAAALLAAFAPFVPRARSQSAMPHIAAVDPASGKVGDTVTLTGTNLGKASVAGVYLSDDKTDYKATVVDQAAEKLVLKVPQVKPGSYNLSVQSGTQILILPVRFTVE